MDDIPLNFRFIGGNPSDMKLDWEIVNDEIVLIAKINLWETFSQIMDLLEVMEAMVDEARERGNN